MASKTLPPHPNSARATVSAIWNAHLAVRQAADNLGSISAPTFGLSGDHPADVAGMAGHNILPAILAVPARTADEAMMQILALAELVTLEADTEEPVLSDTVKLWRTALVSIVHAMAEGSALPPGLTPAAMTGMVGRGAVDGIRARIAALDALDVAPAAA
ncbi:MAG: hypothetical protein HY985_17835 [Magnetospirillum sp.]|nr:hypothetical protein [Magnetospirillum sp.]